MTLDGRIKCNCPACLEPRRLIVTHGPTGAVHIDCPCGFKLLVPPGPNPAMEVALELIGADAIGERKEGSRLVGVWKGEAQDVIPPDPAPDTDY